MHTYQFANPVQNQIDDVLANGVVAAGVVVGGVLLAGDQLLRVEQLTVRARAHLVCKQVVMTSINRVASCPLILTWQPRALITFARK